MCGNFPATMDGLTRSTDFLRETLAASKCPPKACSRLMVAFDEIVSNIVHYSGANDFTVEIDFPEDPSAVKIAFSDSGKPFNPLATESPDVSLSADEREVGGLGLFMVKKMMDNVTYAHEDGRNVLTISKLRDA